MYFVVKEILYKSDRCFDAQTFIRREKNNNRDFVCEVVSGEELKPIPMVNKHTDKIDHVLFVDKEA